jgi:hypothetical protein
VILVEGQVKICCNHIKRAWVMLLCCYIVPYWEILDQNRPVCWSIVVKEKPTVGSPYFGAYSSDRIPEATKNVNGTFLYSQFYLQV